MRALTFCDISPFYCAHGGGIRTYHRAKIEWFRGQQRHRYVLVHPGPRRATETLGPTVTLEQVYGPRLTRNRDGYRLPLDVMALRRLVATLAPDVLELDDPWFSGPVGLLARRFGKFPGLLASFYHSDPIATYIEPVFSAARSRAACRSSHSSATGALRFRSALARGTRGAALRAIERLFFRLQASYDVTIVASGEMERRLGDRGVRKTVRAPFGVHPRLFDIRRALVRPKRRVRLLYAGRLHADKDVRLLLDVIPRLLAGGNVRVSVAGVGPLAAAAAAISDPNFCYLGFIGEAERMAAIYEAHDVLLAPGRHETFGLTALEGAAAGLLVVGPDRGATAELLREMGSPFVFAAGDADAFAERIGAAIESPSPEVVERQRAVARRYGTWDDAIGRLVRTYEELVESCLNADS